MAKKRLLMVVGSGASIDFGLPTVGEVGKIASDGVQSQYPLADVPASNLYQYIEERIQGYWKASLPMPPREPHFEDVLYAIFALAAAYPAGVFTSPLAALIRTGPFPDINFFDRQRKTVGRDELHLLGLAAVDAIVDGFRQRCATTQTSKAVEFAELQALVTALKGDFDIAVVTLNYDNVMHRAFPGIEIGFDPSTRRFDEKRIFRRTGWACMLHLHGSVHFDMPFDAAVASARDLHEIQWQPNINGPFAQNASGRSSQKSQEGADFPTSVIVAGYGKPTQILRQPFRTYYSELDRLVDGCDALLVVGYGFGDTHVNAALNNFRVRS
jgi:SIR2-like domain